MGCDFFGATLGARGCLNCDLGDFGGMGCDFFGAIWARGDGGMGGGMSDFFGAMLGARGWGDLRWGDV